RAWPVLLQGPDQAGTEPGQGGVGVDLVQADLDVAPADAPAPGDVVGVVAPAEQLPQPGEQGPLEPLDLCGASGDDLAGGGVALDLGVEVIDETGQVRLDQPGHGGDLPGRLVGPADVGLQLLVAAERLVRASQLRRRARPEPPDSTGMVPPPG